MAIHYGVTNKELLERVLLAAQTALLADIPSEKLTGYYDGKSAAAR